MGSKMDQCMGQCMHVATRTYVQSQVRARRTSCMGTQHEQ